MSLSLQQLHTFHLPVSAREIITATSSATLGKAWRYAIQTHQPIQLLGEGSNVLFLDDFDGIILLNRIRGIELTESETDWRLRVGAGENWHNLVKFTLAQGIGGLENLALIPGCCGAAPIQNIGAYGMEFAEVCEYVELLDLQRDKVIRLTAAECNFGYRDSAFKHQYHTGFAITHVGLKLSKRWRPMLTYGELTSLNAQSVTAHDIFSAVCRIRTDKLPDPSITGNAGSFFKNPIVSAELAEQIVTQAENAPRYPQSDGRIKLAAGWLIDQCALKGHQSGGAAVDRKQALVLINQHQATSKDVLTLAREVRQRVAQRFSVWLEPEVRFIGPAGEIDSVKALSE